MSGISTGAEQINEAVGRVKDISNVNKEHINVLVSEISKFKAG
jgi:hypothetical protein